MTRAFRNSWGVLQGIVGVILAMLAAAPLSAQMPLNPGQPLPTAVTGAVMTQTASGLSVTVDSRWLDGQGYRPVRISVSPIVNVAADRDLLIRITTDRYYYSNDSDPLVVTKQYLSIPSGTQAGQTIKTTVSLPPSSIWTDCSIEIIDPSTVKGTVFKQMQMKAIGNRLGLSGMDVILTKYPHILFVGTSTPDTSAITDLMPQAAALRQYQGGAGLPGGTTMMPDGTVVVNNAQGNTATGAVQTTPVIPLPTAIAFLAADLPDRWLDYTSMDVICLSIDQLADLANSHRTSYRAILEWTNAGGNLWIYGLEGTEGKWDCLSVLNELLQLPKAGEANKDKPEASGWDEPNEELVEEAVRSNSLMNSVSGVQLVPDGNAPTGDPARKPSPSAKPPLLLRAYGMGTVAAISSPNPFAGGSKWSTPDWVRLFASSHNRLSWNTRHGMNVGEANADFWNFLIPGVGLAPVRTFQVFITLFVLGIGPANYWLLKRKRRLHLMVLTVPLSAAVVTGLLFGYAVVADGLGIRLRVRSVTQLDQRRGEAATWARLSYYAGIAPSDGLTFSPQTAVYPIRDSSELDYRSTSRKTMSWDEEDRQRLERGWLDARTPTQYLAIRTRKSSRRLDIAESADAKGPLKFENRLGTPIMRLAICGRDGKYYAAEDIGEGAKAEAKETTAQEIESWFRTEVTKNQPEYPLGVNPRDWNRSWFLSSNRHNWFARNVDEVPLSVSLLERSLGGLSSNGGRFTPTIDPSQIPLKRGTYVAFVQFVPELELGTESAQEASFHVIVGEW